MAPTDADDGLRLAATGDAIISRPVAARVGRDAGFDPMVDRLRGADAAVTNLELVVTDGDLPATPPRVVTDQYQYLASFPGMVLHAPPSILDDLSTLGLDLFATASNHSMDFGRAGLHATMDALEARSLPYAGLGRSLPAARAPAHRSSPGGRVGLVAATTSVPPGGEAVPPASRLPGAAGINPLHVRWRYAVTPDQLDTLEELAAATGIDEATETWRSREVPPGTEANGFRFMHMTFEAVEAGGAPGITYDLHEPDRRAILESIRESATVDEYTVMSLHCHQAPGGTRNVPATPSFLVDFAHDCIDAGADAFVGTGPHVLRGMEVYRDRPIFYSLGNFFCQFETIERLPRQSFEYYGLPDDGRASAVFDARYYDEDGTPTGNLATPAYWQTVLPTCDFDRDGTLEGIELLPCSLGRTRKRARRGTPRQATPEQATSILESLAELSAPFGTDIEREDGVGYVTV